MALKVLPTAVAADPQRLNRFLQDARAASKISGAHAAHIYEIGERRAFEFEVDQGISDRRPGWTTDGRGITYVLNRGGVSNIWSQPLAGGKPVQLTDFQTDRIFAFAYSRAGTLAVSRGTIANDVVLISAFK